MSIKRIYLNEVELDEKLCDDEFTVLCTECLDKTNCRELNLLSAPNFAVFCCEAIGCEVQCDNNPKGLSLWVVDLPKIGGLEYLKRMEAYRLEQCEADG